MSTLTWVVWPPALVWPESGTTEYSCRSRAASMTICAHFMCILADMEKPTPAALPNPDDLLVLLAVARSGRFTTAAESLGLNHTTVSRRIASLEQALGGRVLSRTVGVWELTELGRKATEAAEGVESAVARL